MYFFSKSFINLYILLADLFLFFKIVKTIDPINTAKIGVKIIIS